MEEKTETEISDSGHHTGANSDEYTGTEKSSQSSSLVTCLKGNLLTLLTVFGVLAGVGLGFILREVKNPEEWTPREVMYVKYVGDLFLRMLKALILPLIVSSLVSAIGSLDLTLSRKIGFRAIGYYMATTVIAVVLGMVLVAAIRPGKNGLPNGEVEEQEIRHVMTEDTLMDLVRNMFPPNLIQATIFNFQTVLVEPENFTMTELLNTTQPKKNWKLEESYVDGTNILGLVVFSCALGITLGKLGPKGKPLLDMFVSLSESMMIITNWVVWFSPIAVCFLIAGQLVEQTDLVRVFEMVGMYFVTVMLGLFVHGLIVLPLLYAIITRTLPFHFLSNMTQALATAFGTSSSSATLPITLGCLEEKNKIDPRVTRFVIPIGATINMDGTALYEAVAAIWISQMMGKELGVANIIAISITSTAAAIGAAGIPQAGLVTMVMVLNTIGIPASYVSYVVPLDWLLDRFRTVINVLGDSIGAGIVYHLSKGDLDKMGLPVDSAQISEASVATSESTLETPSNKKTSLNGLSFQME